jgi:hypothetical protein
VPTLVNFSLPAKNVRKTVQKISPLRGEKHQQHRIGYFKPFVGNFSLPPVLLNSLFQFTSARNFQFTFIQCDFGLPKTSFSLPEDRESFNLQLRKFQFTPKREL